MNQPIFGIVTVGLCLLLAGGCSHKDAVVTKEPLETTRKIDKPTVVLVPPTVTSGKVVNTIAAVVNDEIITLYEVNREAQSVIREAETKDKWKHLTVSEVLAYSSNIGTTKIAFMLGDDGLRKALLDGSRTIFW